MLRESDWSDDREYETGSENDPFNFYMEGLSNSNEFSLLLGYFSSSSISLLSEGFAYFISRGGKMRLVINHLLSEKDKHVFENADEIASKRPFDLNNIIELENALNDYDVHFFECLAYMISKKRIEIKIIKPKKFKGISHYKSGVFSDGENKVSYRGSCNFTLYGLSENLEHLNTFMSWDDEKSLRLTKKHDTEIDNFFNENDERVNYLSINEIETVIKDKFGNKDIEELLVDEVDLLTKKLKLTNNLKVSNSIKKIHDQIKYIRDKPKFPFKEGPHDYQIKAYDSWVENNYTGMFAMATGTGKTITSLNCLLNEYKKTNTYRAVIVVPTKALVEQWKNECAEFNFRNIITVSTKEKWDKNLSFFNTAAKLTDASYIVIVTYASLPSKKFLSYFNNLPINTILIADETHNMGSKRILGLMPKINLKKRIGLSATPNRKFDQIGNEAIETFFDDKPPFIVSYSMKEALDNGRLCKYTYYPHLVRLTDSEMNKYKELSLQLLRMGLFDKDSGSFRSTPEIEKKLLERKRIIHKAFNKLEKFKLILKEEFLKRKNLNYTLIYVPEGKEPNYEDYDYSLETEEEQDLITKYTRAVSNIDDSIIVKQFTSKTKNRDEILKKFEQNKINVLTSMKCLDEGVDVPRSELAIFCASTGNPRQFIQRRGRVLRTHHDKTHAVIHDLVVVPVSIGENTFEMERGLMKKELERVVDFASLALNKTHTFEILKDLLTFYKLNLNDL